MDQVSNDMKETVGDEVCKEADRTSTARVVECTRANPRATNRNINHFNSTAALQPNC